MKKFHCGFIAVLGRPNVGKSTLINHIIGDKVSITSKKPQTTRHRILGIKTTQDMQLIFVDTPGVHLNPKHKINKIMIKAALTTLRDVDIICFMIDARKWTSEDELVLQKIKYAKLPVIVLVNKIDRIANKNDLLPLLQALQLRLTNEGLENFTIIPMSAKKGDNLQHFLTKLTAILPENPQFYPADQITDRSQRFMAAELIREKLLRFYGEEVPHELAVEIEQFKTIDNILHISALIWVERVGQKKILIGKHGERLKEVGRLARIDMEKMFGSKVFLRLWIKIKRGWSDSERALLSLGYLE